MKTCLNCGKENENLICDKCKNNVDDIISKLTNNFTFFEIYSNNRELFYQSAKICLTNDWLQQDKKEHIIQAIFVNKFKDYNYFEAEEFANIIKTNENINKYVLYELGKYYLYTRRYEIAEKYLGKRLTIMENADDEKIKKAIQKSYDEIEKRKKGLMAEYMPLKPEIQAKYCEFMNSIGFDLERKIEQAPRTRSSLKAKISAEAYPNIKKQEINNFNFDTFVAFDIETTGFKRKKSTLAKAGKIDDIIEIAAIKVINGKIDESSSFKFQELVHPLKQKISKEIETLTGITNEMVYDAKQIYEVFPKFMEFVDDNILVGFNCINFDCDFLIRAGRYSNIIIKNNFFDIYRNLEKLNIKPISLNELSKQYNIINENAHRALSDAVTTAKLYLKLKNKFENTTLKVSKVNIVQPIKIINGTYQNSDTMEEIWNNLLSDCDNKTQEIVKSIIQNYPKNTKKPIYYPTVEFIKDKKRIIVNELWENSKVMLFLPENKEDYNIAKQNGWKCFLLDNSFDLQDFLRSVK